MSWEELWDDNKRHTLELVVETKPTRIGTGVNGDILYAIPVDGGTVVIGDEFIVNSIVQHIEKPKDPTISELWKRAADAVRANKARREEVDTDGYEEKAAKALLEKYDKQYGEVDAVPQARNAEYLNAADGIPDDPTSPPAQEDSMLREAEFLGLKLPSVEEQNGPIRSGEFVHRDGLNPERSKVRKLAELAKFRYSESLKHQQIGALALNRLAGMTLANLMRHVDIIGDKERKAIATILHKKGDRNIRGNTMMPAPLVAFMEGDTEFADKLERSVAGAQTDSGVRVPRMETREARVIDAEAEKEAIINARKTQRSDAELIADLPADIREILEGKAGV
ncbi:MAG: hypothetical protein CMK74_20150 [Pseudomonadales bacterium]|nr:hypothetical protein [Pseudomonadales bacterium]